MPLTLARLEAVERLQNLIGQDLRPLADEYGVTVFLPNGNFNKGWAGQVCECYLGQQPNSSKEPDFIDPDTGSWELKAVSIRRKKDDSLTPKETMAITGLNPTLVATTPFEQSSLWLKIRSLVICGREFVDRAESSSPLLSVGAFDLEADLVAKIKADYEAVQAILNGFATPDEGFLTLSGKMGVYVQPRTKGRGHGSKTRAFYFRTSTIKQLLNL